MNHATSNAVRAGAARGLLEFRGTFTNPPDLFGYLYMPVLFVALGFFLSGEEVDGAATNYGAVTYSGGLVLMLIMLGTLAVAQVLAAEREDGTFLRAKAIPHGMLGYGVAKVVHLLSMSAVAVALTVVPGLFLVEGFGPPSWGAALTLVWVCVLGLLAMAPIGATLGALISNPRAVGLMMIPIMALLMLSGVLFPLELLPDWVFTVARALPVYWLGQGVRAGTLPTDYGALELAGAWQLPVVAAVLAAWAVVGSLVALRVLRRMARRESGSRVQAAREKAMKRVL
ncbi:ABC transporter permease [Nocardiopsis sp. EMB25]|uniref:ABC transporter permease n=1 Tax=Nocardiopsis sp. EMB25 TaxID=2835867 RepID=UPI002284EE1C|nr:ABC transporter permease [Nocardiopsis sp. EMB25]MCY9786363.1 ABC transporter permease [Nocardiopsis sp. EMB25]